MLFYITNSLIVKEGDERYKQIRKAIRNVLTGYSENKLLLMADFEVLEWMLLKFENDEDLISPIKYLYNNFSLLVVPDDICCYFEIVSGAEFIAYLDKLLGKPQIPEELWEEDVQKLLQNPAKLKNYPFEMTEEILKKYLNK